MEQTIHCRLMIKQKTGFGGGGGGVILASREYVVVFFQDYMYQQFPDTIISSIRHISNNPDAKHIPIILSTASAYQTRKKNNYGHKDVDYRLKENLIERVFTLI